MREEGREGERGGWVTIGGADVKRAWLWLGLEGGIDRQKEMGGWEGESIWLMVGVMGDGGSA